MGKNTKIDWATSSWNPVTGCLHGCPYCYARKIAERFGGGTTRDSDCHVVNHDVTMYDADGARNLNLYPYGFAPTLHRNRFNEIRTWRESQKIFVCSMADLFGAWVPEEWITSVFNTCANVPRHTYLFLTKNPARYIELEDKGLLPDRDNFWYGSTVTNKDMDFFFSKEHHCFLSIEPIQGDLGGGKLTAIDWVIIGGETGNRRNRVTPKKEWIDNIVRVCDASGVPVLMKENIRELMGEEFRQDFPWSK